MRLAYEAPALRLVALRAGDVVRTSDGGDNDLSFSSLTDDSASAGSNGD